MIFTFAKHETFYIRDGWLRKGLMAIEKNGHIFLEDDAAMDELGIGKNMISSLRYWMQAVYLTREDYFGNGYKEHQKTYLGELISECDPYLEDIGTYWLLHYFLITDRADEKATDVATAWQWFFNEFHFSKFTKELFIDEISEYIKRQGERVPAGSSLEKDFTTFINTYLYEPENNSKNPEDLIRSPFDALRLIRKGGRDEYIVNRPSIDLLDEHILYYCLAKNLEEHKTDQVEVTKILTEKDSIGKVFRLDISSLYKYLDLLQEKELVRLEKQAGMNLVTLLGADPKDVVKEYYGSRLA